MATINNRIYRLRSHSIHQSIPESAMAGLQELQRQRGMKFLLVFVVAIEILSFCVFSVDGFAMTTSSQATKSTGAFRFPLFAHPEDSVHDNNLPTSYVLKQRNPYDVHVYYGTPEEQEAAMELRQEMQTAFPWMRFYDPKEVPIGPHPLPMWEADFGAYENRYKWATVRDFVLDNNPKNLSILIHPHSVDGDYADHTRHAFWAGDTLELRIRGWK